jgi:hypothetical protein
MPDEDRVVVAIMDLMNQVARVAWALETAFLDMSHAYEDAPCARCLSQLVPVGADKCPACYEPTKEKTDG